MDFLFIVLLGCGLIYLWNRADRLETRLGQFEEMVDILGAELAQLRAGKAQADPGPEDVPDATELSPNGPGVIPAHRLFEEDVAQSKAEPNPRPAPVAEKVYPSSAPAPSESASEPSRFSLPKLSFDFIY